MRSVWTVLALSVGLVGCGTDMATRDIAPVSREGVSIVPAGREITLERSYMTLDKQCRPKPLPRLTIEQQPAHGRAWPIAGPSQPNYGPGPYQHCNSRMVQAAAIRYQANANYRGPDSVVVRVRFQNGEVHSERVPVTVR